MNASTLRSSARAAVVVALGFAWLMQASCARSISDEDSSDPPLFAQDAGDAIPNPGCVALCPAPWATCDPGSDMCTTDTSRSVNNCGACNAVCPGAAGGTALCAGGKCTFACRELFADCNKQASDGCEVSTVDDPNNCGFCGNVCNDADGGVDEGGASLASADGGDGGGGGTGLCWRGACGCPKGFTQCGQECDNLQADNANCGACGNKCQAPTSPTDPAWKCGSGIEPDNTTWTCTTGACTLQCKPLFGDCNNVLCTDGCEIDLRDDPLNCGACGTKCDAGQTCSNGSCLCPTGTVLCGDVCVDTNVDPSNCGTCGVPCDGPSDIGGGPSCRDGTCGYTCAPGYADCDGDLDDGCETNLSNNPRHCGSCANHCPLGSAQPCVGGVCLTRECDAGVVL